LAAFVRRMWTTCHRDGLHLDVWTTDNLGNDYDVLCLPHDWKLNYDNSDTGRMSDEAKIFIP